MPGRRKSFLPTKVKRAPPRNRRAERRTLPYRMGRIFMAEEQLQRNQRFIKNRKWKILHKAHDQKFGRKTKFNKKLKGEYVRTAQRRVFVNRVSEPNLKNYLINNTRKIYKKYKRRQKYGQYNDNQ